MHFIVNHLQEAFGSGPTPQDLVAAEQQILNDASFPMPKDVKLRESVVRCVAMGFVAKRKYLQSGQIKPQVSEDQLRRQEIFKRIERDHKVSSFMVGVRSIYSEVSFSDPNTKQTDVVNWLTNDFTKSGKKHALLLGTTGRGKTYGAIGYIATISDIGRCAYVKAFKLSELLNARNYQALDHYEKVKHLIVDDLGVSQAGYKGEDFNSWFENMFCTRYEYGLTTIITSNATPEQIKETFGERFVSRFREDGMLYVTNGPDMRVA
jgi:DNA replication protein DnaC